MQWFNNIKIGLRLLPGVALAALFTWGISSDGVAGKVWADMPSEDDLTPCLSKYLMQSGTNYSIPVDD